MQRYFDFSKNDDWETPAEYLKIITPFLNKENIIYDPFYFNGKIKEKWENLGYECIHKNENFYDVDVPANKNIIIVSNPPYHNKNKMLKKLFDWDLPFILLMPIQTIAIVKTQRLLKNKNIQIIIPNIYKGFISKDGKQTKCPPFYICYICYNMNLERDIIYL